jgi:hypothetical protein
MARGLLLALIHLVIVSSLGGKLLYDRATRPRVWAETVPYDPELPIRGRYVSLRLLVDAPDLSAPAQEENRWQWYPVTLHAEGDRLVVHSAPPGEVPREPGLSMTSVSWVLRGDVSVPALTDPVAFFIPEHVEDPSRRPPGESLWVEVTVPRRGPPRPIRLGVRKDGEITPLPLD